MCVYRWVNLMSNLRYPKKDKQTAVCASISDTYVGKHSKPWSKMVGPPCTPPPHARHMPRREPVEGVGETLAGTCHSSSGLYTPRILLKAPF